MKTHYQLLKIRMYSQICRNFLMALLLRNISWEFGAVELVKPSKK